MKFRPSEGAHDPPLAALLHLDDAQFRARFRGSPIKRIGRDRFVRNVLVAAGNSGNPALLDDIMPLLSDTSPLVRGIAVWASRRLADADREAELKERYASQESDVLVRAEWDGTP